MSKANDNADTEFFMTAMAMVRKNFHEGKTASETKHAFERLYNERLAWPRNPKTIAEAAVEDVPDAPS
ncbi:hypothetical protein [Shinella sedimenti]|uniref:Uncharacterized protein n=1 Tax=Shinella sedimenti TaxID=2919913 RepID=A0ABT0CQ38_9HYPH|nr:hypothetical protein [Shinella sedimenti]MCJ8150720.1 hypothetical protein [Shinella sedimenti]